MIKRDRLATSPKNHIKKRLKEISPQKRPRSIIYDAIERVERLQHFRSKLKALSLKKRKVTQTETLLEKNQEEEKEVEPFPPIVSQFCQIISDLCKSRQNELIYNATDIQIGELLVRSLKTLITESEEYISKHPERDSTLFKRQIDLVQLAASKLKNPIFFANLIASIQLGQNALIELERYGDYIRHSTHHNLGFVINVFSKNQLIMAGCNKTISNFVRPLLETIGMDHISLISFFESSEYY